MSDGFYERGECTVCGQEGAACQCGDPVPALRDALARSEERERALREALAEALSAVEIARPTLRAASLRPDASDAAWDAMLQRWRAALSQESPAPTAAPPGHADLMVPPETIGPYLAREARASVALDGDTHCVDAPAAPTPGTKTER